MPVNQEDNRQQKILIESFNDDIEQFAKNIVAKLSSTGFMNTADKIKEIDINERCKPPTRVSKSFKKFLDKKKDNITINIENNKKIFLKIFWTGYNEFTQSLACKLAQLYTEQVCVSGNREICGGRAVEMTSSPHSFIEIFGQWNEQLEHIKIFYNQNSNPNSDTNSETLRKAIWDNISTEYAKYYPPDAEGLSTYALLVLPINLPSDYLNKTLIKIEIPNLQCNKVSILFFHKETADIYKLDSTSEDFKFVKWQHNDNTPLELHFVEFNPTMKDKLLNFFNKLNTTGRHGSVLGQLEIVKHGGRSKRKIKKSKKRKIKKSKKIHVRKRTRRYYKKQK